MRLTNTTDQDLPAPRYSRTAMAAGAFVVTTAASVAALWAWNSGAQHRAIERLPTSERRALYERTLRTLESSCSEKEPPGGLEEFCRQQADFVVQFPECDAACLSAAEPCRTKPTR